MMLGLVACTRVSTFSVGLPPCGLPLNSSTQPLMMKLPLAFAVASPVPTSDFLQAFMAPAMTACRKSLVGTGLATANANGSFIINGCVLLFSDFLQAFMAPAMVWLL